MKNSTKQNVKSAISNPSARGKGNTTAMAVAAKLIDATLVVGTIQQREIVNKMPFPPKCVTLNNLTPGSVTGPVLFDPSAISVLCGEEK